MQVSRLIALLLGICLWAGLTAEAITFQYTDGTKLEADIVRASAKALQVRTTDNKYVDIDWGKLSQETLQDLKKLAEEKNDSRLWENVEPYIEIPEEEIIKRTEVKVNTSYDKLELPPKGSLLGAMFTSSVGIFCMLLLYAANIYAGYEIALIRAYQPLLVCGISAVAPVIGPVVFLCLPTKMEKVDESDEIQAAGEEGAHSATYAVPGDPAAAAAETAATGTHAAAGPRASGAVPQTQVFKRGQFTFNRRFVETKFTSFFGAIRRGNDKDMVLLIKSARGEFIANRITRVAASDMHIEALKGGGTQEVQVPFGEIQEIHLKHRDA